MAKTFTDSVEFLTEAKTELARLNEAKTRQQDLELAEKQQAKTLEAEKKVVEDNVNSTVKKRQDELEASYNKEISKAQDAVKKAQTQREKAKQQGIKDRITSQQAPLQDENKQLKAKIRSILKEDKAPRFCDTTLYYALYFPKAVKEVLLMLLIFVVCFIGVPLLIFELIPAQKTIWLALIYVVVIVVFGGLYLLFGNLTKNHHRAAIAEAQKVRRSITKNKKKMRSVARSIRREKSEEHYDLTEYDRELEKRQQEKTEIQAKKDAAVNDFLNTTKPAITEEIVSGSREKITALEAEHDETVKKVQENANLIKETSLSITNDYESYIGKEFMQEEILNDLIRMIQSGEAKTITEAEGLWRQKQQTPKK